MNREAYHNDMSFESQNGEDGAKTDENKPNEPENKHMYHRPTFGQFQSQMGHVHVQHGHVFGEKYQPLPPSEVTCFKCGEKGHYANKCNKGVFAFLRSQNDSDK